MLVLCDAPSDADEGEERRLAELEVAVTGWLANAGGCNRVTTERRLRFARALINRLEVGFSRDAWAFERARDSVKEERTVDWLRRELRMSLNAANAALQVGLFADELPKSVDAAEEGRIGFGHLSKLAGVAEWGARLPVVVPDDELAMSGDERPPAWTEDALLAKAEKQPIGKFATTCQLVQHELDADGITQQLRTQMEGQRLMLMPRSDGSLELCGWLDPENGALLRTALEPLSAPSNANDTRRLSLRRATALGELARIALEAGKVPTRGGVRPHISIVAGVDTLSLLEGATAARDEFNSVLPDHTARRLACDSTVSRVILDSRSVPIDVGREARVVTPALLRALTARDGGCRWPTCGVPPARCQAHHLVHWIDGGETNLANCMLLCRRHHTQLHEGMWELRGDPNGEITVRERCEPDRHGKREFNWINAPVPGWDGERALAEAKPADHDLAWWRAVLRNRVVAADTS